MAAAVEVIPGLLLASASSASAEALSGLGVTHLLNVTPDRPMPAREPPFFSWHVPVFDDLSSPLHEHLEGAAAFVDAALASGGRVCAFCTNGVSAGPTVVAFYLMRHKALPLADALATIQAARPDAAPNIGFWQRLVEAESWLRGVGEPSVSLQNYKWGFLERNHPGVAREEILRQLELGQAEVEELLRVSTNEWSSA